MVVPLLQPPDDRQPFGVFGMAAMAEVQSEHIGAGGQQAFNLFGGAGTGAERRHDLGLARSLDASWRRHSAFGLCGGTAVHRWGLVTIIPGRMQL